MRIRRRSAVIRLAVVLALVLGAAVYFLKFNPLYAQIHKGLDLQGGVEVVYQATGTPQQPLNTTTLQQTVQVMSLRVDSLGVTDPVIQAEPPSRILVELPGVKDPNQALAEIGATANLEFKDSAGTPIVTGKDLKSAQAASQNGQPVVIVTFDGAGQKLVSKWTLANQGKPMSIYLDNKLLEAPVVQPGCCSGANMVITGSATPAAAQALAVELNSGALPLTLSVLSKTTVSATLGQDSVHASTTAFVLALVLVLAFMFLVYRIPGFWADMALLVYALVLMAVLVGINATLTLPGITGMILSIGMAVDSNVIIYERIREELRGGRPLKTAVDEGFRHGIRAILDSNATTVIAAVVLYYLGTGLIRGFAVTVGLGVLVSLMTAVVFTRYLLRWLVEAGSRPSWWFFAPRAAVATAGAPAGGGSALAAAVHGLGPAAAPPVRSRRPGPFNDTRRDWQPDIPVVAPEAPRAAEVATPAAQVAREPLAPPPATEPAPTVPPVGGAPPGPHRSGHRTGKRRHRGGKGGR